MNVNVTTRIPNKPHGLKTNNWWINIGKKAPPGYFIPVNNGGRLKIVPGKPNPHGVWLVVNNRVILNGNKIANRKKVISSGTSRPREKTLFQAWQNRNSASARNMIRNLTSLKMDQRIAVKQMIHEIIRERNAAMKNANWKMQVGIGRNNALVTSRHQMTIDFWKWISAQINTGRLASPRVLRTPRTTSSSASRSRSRGRSTATRAVPPPNAWNN